MMKILSYYLLPAISCKLCIKCATLPTSIEVLRYVEGTKDDALASIPVQIFSLHYTAAPI